jgi:hypothetical protein
LSAARTAALICKISEWTLRAPTCGDPSADVESTNC